MIGKFESFWDNESCKKWILRTWNLFQCEVCRWLFLNIWVATQRVRGRYRSPKRRVPLQTRETLPIRPHQSPTAEWCRKARGTFFFLCLRVFVGARFAHLVGIHFYCALLIQDWHYNCIVESLLLLLHLSLHLSHLSPPGANVFRSFVAQEGDTEMKKEVSSVIFGSSVTGVGEPEHSPEAAGGQGHQSAL